MIFLFFILMSFIPSSESKAFSPVKNPQMLEITTRPWLYLLSQKYEKSITKLSQIPQVELQSFADSKYDVVWFMGVWSLGAFGLNHDRTDPGLLEDYAKNLPGYTKDDIIGSPYAITQYTCNPELGSDDDIAILKKKLNALGIGLMLDFVPNHSAVDSNLTKQIEYFVRDSKKSPPYDNTRYLPNGVAYGWSGWGGAWTDTAQLNYWNEDLRTAQIHNILKIASLSDYIRCDMAYLALNDVIQQNWGTQNKFWGYSKPNTEFWSNAITLVKAKYPNLKLLAEVYSPYPQNLQDIGFDYTYDKQIYDRLGVGNLDNIRGYVSGVPLKFHQHSAHFVENHDEPRAAAFFGGNMRADSAAMVSMTLPGMRFYNQDQNKGFFNRIDVHLRRAKREPSHPGVESFYANLTKILSQPIFHEGSWNYENVVGADNSWRLVAWKWTLGNKKVLCVINYSDQKASGKIILPDATPINGNDNIPVTELLSKQVYMRSAKQMQTEGLFVIINYWSMQMFEYV